MKKRFISLCGLCVLLLLIGCDGSVNHSIKKNISIDDLTIEITVDTFHFNVKSNIDKVVLSGNDYITIFKETRLKAKPDFKKEAMFLFNQKGKMYREISLPWNVKRLRLYRLEVANDSLFFLREDGLKSSNFKMSLNDFQFEELEIENRSLLVDEKYEIYASCNGEWGGTIFFKDKNSDAVYEGSSTCVDIINKINDEYYITNYMPHMHGFASVLRISDPKKMKKSSNINALMNRTIEEQISHSSWDGMEVLMDTLGFRIQESFVLKEKLLHLYFDESGTFIGEVKNDSVVPKYKFDFTFYPEHHQVTADGKHVLSFLTKEELENGILVIDNNKMDFHFIK